MHVLWLFTQRSAPCQKERFGHRLNAETYGFAICKNIQSLTAPVVEYRIRAGPSAVIPPLAILSKNNHKTDLFGIRIAALAWPDAQQRSAGGGGERH